MVELKFHCCMPMFIARQWIRHRTASVNEYSGRYSLVPMLFYSPDEAQLQTQSKRNNQGRSGQTVGRELYDEAQRRWAAIRRESTDAYGWLTGEPGGARAGAHRPAAVDVHAVVLEDRPPQPAALPDPAGGRARAVGDPGVRAGDGRHVEARGAAVVRGLDRLRRLRHARVARRAVGDPRAGRRRGRQPPGQRRPPRSRRRWRGTAWPSAKSTSCSPSWRPRPPSPDFELDVSQARSAEHFAERFASAVPSGEKPTE